MGSTALYTNHGKNISQKDLLEALQSIHLRSGDVVFVHSDVSVFGRYCSTDKNYLLESIVSALKEIVGNNGTVIMPTFSYSYCKNKVYDIQSTLSTVGALTEYFRTRPDVARTKEPIFSVAIWGKRKEYFSKVGNNCFDNKSIFAKLYKSKAKILFLGASFQSCTFIHYIEQQHGVPYRFIKEFKGTTKDSLKTTDTSCYYNVRYLDREVITDTDKLEKYLLDQEIMKQTVLGSGRILSITADKLYRAGIRLLDRDIYYFLKKPVFEST